MADATHFDVVIIGGGQAGIPLAYGLAAAGRRVALAERRNLGGSCVNFGCTPTKAAIASARVAHLARRAGDFGLGIDHVTVDFAAVIERARNIALASRHSLDAGMQASDNPRLLRGHARLDGRAEGEFRLRVDGKAIMTGTVVLNTGTRSLIPPIEGLTGIPYLHAGNWLDCTELPRHLAVLGAGPIGLEMAQFYRRMGSEVSVIEAGHSVAGREDTDVATALRLALEAEGITFQLHATVTRFAPVDGGIMLRFDSDQALTVSHVFVATGRRPNTDDLGLETVGATISARGIIDANERLATNVPGLWVAGDVRGGPQFTHTSWDDHRVLMSQLAGDGSRTTRRIVPYAIFTDPELGRVGMTEAEARRAGHIVKIGRFLMERNGKAVEIGETKGFIKVVADANTDRILGAAVLCAEAAELVHCYIDVMNGKLPLGVIADAVHIHPTLAEAIQSAVAAIGGADAA